MQLTVTAMIKSNATKSQKDAADSESVELKLSKLCIDSEPSLVVANHPKKHQASQEPEADTDSDSP
jgi:hypothetical protein